MLNRRMKLTAVMILVFVLLMSAMALGAYEPFKVKLGLFDRMVCLAILPPEGSYATLKIVRELQMELAPTEEENIKAGLISDLISGGVTIDDPDDPEKGWDAVEPKEIIFGDIAKGIIVAALEKLNDAEKLTQQHVNLYAIFVEGKIEDEKEGE